MSFEARIKELGIEIPEPARPLAAYVPTVRTGNLVFVSGQLPTRGGELVARGKLGEGVSLEDGQEAARVAAINALAALRAELGSLDLVRRIVKLTGYVASAPGFVAQPQVINGASELMQAVFGESGRHARAAVGVSELPNGAPVEVELIAEVAI
ncbi:Endoribonuclease L-PSP [Thermobaculum terrenum ATCC BAA-798]|uniref:Endoribonuclease L-PSP n=1 Tax=Thermobaculum terrenum (strain ATCC BAA-798 / CCMEE 7001 / YNP1) TaxID=525904 RepID=D1CGH9_THET1|nr:RidA family protein [Thermobaculum terrenum]ACZ42850.1 Endoribonuclease L-PSP [Thermobaculum terrenum ATCC BAA-798]